MILLNIKEIKIQLILIKNKIPRSYKLLGIIILYNDLSSMKSSFQDGVNTLYNKCVSCGVTPSAKTPAAISAAIANIYNNRYSAGAANPTFKKISQLSGTFYSTSGSNRNEFATGITGKVLWKTIFIVPMIIPVSSSANNNFYNGNGITYDSTTGVITVWASYVQMTADIYYIA